MSSSFTDQPSPRDPRHEEGYTPTPPAPAPGRQEDDDESAGPRPRLGSLAQKARGGKLKQARLILFFIGGATFILQIILLFVDLNANVDPLIAVAFHGLFILIGAVFIVFGALIYLYPVAITIISLVLYVLVSLIDLGLAALTDPARMGAGICWKVLFIIALGSSIQSAIAYERERRAEEEYRFDG